jgi:hypothetical protein
VTHFVPNRALGSHVASAPVALRAGSAPEQRPRLQDGASPESERRTVTWPGPDIVGQFAARQPGLAWLSHPGIRTSVVSTPERKRARGRSFLGPPARRRAIACDAVSFEQRRASRHPRHGYA